MHKQVSKWSQLLIVSMGVFLSVIDIFIVNVAIPSIKKGIHGTDGDVQLVIALYLTGYAAFLITGGRAGDYFGKKAVFVTGISLFTLASTFCGLSQTAFQLNISRLVQGISAGIMVPQSIAYIQVLFPDGRERIKALGIYGSIAGSASVIGQLLGGIIPDMNFFTAGWRLIFLINLPFGILAAFFAWKFLPRTTRLSDKKFDFPGVALLSIILVSLVYPIIRGRESGWPLWSIILIFSSVLLTPFFLLNQKRKSDKDTNPLINLKLFEYKDFNIGLIASLLYFMVQDTYFLINAILFQNALELSSSDAGILFSFQGIGYVVASLISIRLLRIYGKYVLIAGVSLMIITLIFHILLLNANHLNTNLLVAVLLGYGMGCGSVLPSLLTMTLKNIPPELAGSASGMYSTFQQTAIALGIGIIGGIFFDKLPGNLTLHAYLQAYNLATYINIGFLLLTGVLLFRFSSTQ